MLRLISITRHRRPDIHTLPFNTCLSACRAVGWAVWAATGGEVDCLREWQRWSFHSCALTGRSRSAAALTLGRGGDDYQSGRLHDDDVPTRAGLMQGVRSGRVLEEVRVSVAVGGQILHTSGDLRPYFKRGCSFCVNGYPVGARGCQCGWSIGSALVSMMEYMFEVLDLECIRIRQISLK